MDLRQLQYFKTVAEEGQITRAAKKLNISQPPLSQQLKLIEEELGTEILIRHNRHVELTEAGKHLYKRAVMILKQMEETKTEIREMGEGIRGLLKIGVARTCATAFLPERINAFLNRYPKVRFQLIDGHPSQVVQLLEEGQVEIALVRFAKNTSLDYEVKQLQVEPYMLFTSKSWANIANGKKGISLHDLRDVPLITVTGSERYNAVYNELENVGIRPEVVCECQDAAILLSLVAAGVGAAIMPKSTIASHPTEGINFYEITDLKLKNESILLWHKNRPLSKVAQSFISTF